MSELKTYTVLIVRDDATTISFQKESYDRAEQEVAEMMVDDFYRIAPHHKVFMSTGPCLIEYTAGELANEYRAKGLANMVPYHKRIQRSGRGQAWNKNGR